MIIFSFFEIFISEFDKKAEQSELQARVCRFPYNVMLNLCNSSIGLVTCRSLSTTVTKSFFGFVLIFLQSPYKKYCYKLASDK